MEARLHRKFYTKSGIKEAIKAFSHLATISLLSEDDYHCCTFVNVEESVEKKIVSEFTNYALYAVQSRKKTW